VGGKEKIKAVRQGNGKQERGRSSEEGCSGKGANCAKAGIVDSRDRQGGGQGEMLKRGGKKRGRGG